MTVVAASASCERIGKRAAMALKKTQTASNSRSVNGS